MSNSNLSREFQSCSTLLLAADLQFSLLRDHLLLKTFKRCATGGESCLQSASVFCRSCIVLPWSVHDVHEQFAGHSSCGTRMRDSATCRSRWLTQETVAGPELPQHPYLYNTGVIQTMVP